MESNGNKSHLCSRVVLIIDEQMSTTRWGWFAPIRWLFGDGYKLQDTGGDSQSAWPKHPVNRSFFRRFWVFVRLLILLMAEIRPGCGFNWFFSSSFFLKIDRNYALDMLSLCCSVGWLNRQLKICFFQPKTSSLQRWVVVYVLCNYVYTKVTHRIHVW